MCDRVVIMNEGEIVARGDLEELRPRRPHADHVYPTVDVPDAVPENRRKRVVEGWTPSKRRENSAEHTAVTWPTYDGGVHLEEVFLNVAEAGSRGTRYVGRTRRTSTVEAPARRDEVPDDAGGRRHADHRRDGLSLVAMGAVAAIAVSGGTGAGMDDGIYRIGVDECRPTRRRGT